MTLMQSKLTNKINNIYSFSLAVNITVVLLILELIMIFIGKTMFLDTISIFSCVIHGLASVFLIFFGLY